jgi:hypothetical protein
MFRELRTRCLAARSRFTRTRATGEPSGALARSIATPVTGASGATLGRASTASALTLRKSTSTVSGSGWLVRYATGSLDSISTVLTAPSRRDEMDLSAGVSDRAVVAPPLAANVTARAATIGAAITSRGMRGCIT